MQEIWYIIQQACESWQGKVMLSAILTVISQLAEQFSTAFGADTFLLCLLFILVAVDLTVALFVSIKERDFGVVFGTHGILKFPLYCLYLFLIGAITVSFEHSINIGLPLLNLFIAYLVATQVFIIVRNLEKLNVKIPPLLLFLVHGLKEKMETTIQTKIGCNHTPEEQKEEDPAKTEKKKCEEEKDAK